MEPNIDELKKCILKMSELMGCLPLPDDKLKDLIQHVLYDKKWGSIDGKNSWACFQRKLITEREIRKLIMQHSCTKIADFNNKCETKLGNPYSKEMCQLFEVALLGRVSISMGGEGRDFWEIDA